MQKRPIKKGAREQHLGFFCCLFFLVDTEGGFWKDAARGSRHCFWLVPIKSCVQDQGEAWECGKIQNVKKTRCVSDNCCSDERFEGSQRRAEHFGIRAHTHTHTKKITRWKRKHVKKKSLKNYTPKDTGPHFSLLSSGLECRVCKWFSASWQRAVSLCFFIFFLSLKQKDFKGIYSSFSLFFHPAVRHCHLDPFVVLYINAISAQNNSLCH